MTPELTQDDIEAAEILYAGFCEQAGVSQDGSPEARRLLAKVENIISGYTAYYEQARRDQMVQVETFKYGSRLRDAGVKNSWYSGPQSHKGFWPDYLSKVQRTLPSDAIADLNKSTSQILGSCANPRELQSKRKGLVVGYVQSGKTANFEGLIAKSVDAGYRVVIVLAGMFNNLREQTQSRLDRDLGLHESGESVVSWLPLTDRDQDFVSSRVPSNILNLPGSVAVAVVKKNAAVLRKLVKWLGSIDRDLLAERPVLIIDDEADQATPNNQAAKEKISAINKLVRQLWKQVETGTYVAYTATPFANVFINPNDREDMYPDDFIYALPEPSGHGYMGASTFFAHDEDVENSSDLDLQLSVEVPELEAMVLTPQSVNIDDYEPYVTESLDEAIRWFIIATAIRVDRSGDGHSTMLIHTSHRVKAHELLADVVNEFVKRLWESRLTEEDSFKRVFEDQIQKFGEATENRPSWPKIWKIILNNVLPNLSVAVENGISESRLTYEDGYKKVIVIGGNTLSRGLTLEGLITSFFLRTSANYDTLLQMGRWFGFRKGYQDLVRLWVAPGLLEDYEHLSRVEADMRERIELMSREDKTPREMALPILGHERLKITSSNRMVAVRQAQVGLSGSRRQTTYLDRDPRKIAVSQKAAQELVSFASDQVNGGYLEEAGGRPSLLFRGISSRPVLKFLDNYWVSESDPWLQPKPFSEWIDKYDSEISWNVVLVSGGGRSVFDFGNGLGVNTVVRTPVKSQYWSSDRLPDQLNPEESDVINIRALMSGDHQVLDLKILNDNRLLKPQHSQLFERTNASSKPEASAARREIIPGEGLILLYVVDKDSQPRESSKGRDGMEAPDHLIGLGVVFPHVANEDRREYFAVEISDDQSLLSEEELAMERAEDEDYLQYLEAEDDEEGEL